jgi:hypothetical protein
MPAVAMAETTRDLSTQRLLFAGQPVLFCTNSSKLAKYASEFLAESENAGADSKPARASITVHVRETDEICERAPLFRARGNFALLRFTSADSFWFNLRAREVFGTCSPALAEDERRWRVHILPALLGMLSATIGVAPVHAACVVREGGGILLTGRSGAGKSTLTIAMARRGHALLSDDWTYLSAPEVPVDCSEMPAWGLPVPVKLLPDADTFFPELLSYRADVSLNGEIAYEVRPEECFGISRSLRCRVRTMVLLERATKPGCSLVPISAGEAFRYLQAEVEPLDGTLACFYQAQLDLIRSAAERAACYRFSFNDHPATAASALDEALGRAS